MPDRRILDIRARTFLDRPSVLVAVENKERLVMMKLGGYVRKVMRSLLGRRGKGPSQPGKPPRRKVGTLYNLTEFGYDHPTRTLVVGPHAITSPTKPRGGKTVPQLHNESGAAWIYGGLSALGQDILSKKVIAVYKPRPFTPQALEKGWVKFRELLRTVPLKMGARRG